MSENFCHVGTDSQSLYPFLAAFPLSIKVRYRDNSYKLERHGDWIDLAVSETYELRAGEFKLLDLGVAIQLPAGYEALLVPRSSTFKKFGVIQANSIGVIDNSYCGKEDWWKMAVIAARDIIIPKGTRVCQFRLLRNQPSFTIIESELSDNNRGGFGTTG